MRQLRAQVGLSQEELAQRAGLHRNYVGGIERGERNVSLINIHKVAEALGVEVTNLFTRPDQEPRQETPRAVPPRSA